MSKSSDVSIKGGPRVMQVIWVILTKTAYFSNEILKEKNRYFLSSFHGNFLYMFLKPFLTLSLSHIHWGWGYSGQNIE